MAQNATLIRPSCRLEQLHLKLLRWRKIVAAKAFIVLPRVKQDPPNEQTLSAFSGCVPGIDSVVGLNPVK